MKKKPGSLLGVIGLVVFFICEGCGAKTNWKLLNQYDYRDGWSAKQYYDSESILKTSEGNISVWIRQDEDKVVKDPLEDLPSFIKWVEINCSSRDVRYLRTLTRLKDGDYEEKGRKDLYLNYMVPDSSKEALYKVLCGESNK